MLSEDIIEKLSERLTLRINEANEYILNKRAESVKEIGSLSFSEAQQIAQILKTGGDYNKIVKKLAETTDLNTNDIKKILTEVAKDYHEFELETVFLKETAEAREEIAFEDLWKD